MMFEFLMVFVGTFIVFLFLNERRKLKSLIATRNKSIMEDLDLATSDQLLNELRKRSGVPYVMISPFSNDDCDGIKIEVHNVPPLAVVKMLELGSTLINKQFEKHGVKLFENQPIELDEDEEKWKGWEE